VHLPSANPINVAFNIPLLHLQARQQTIFSNLVSQQLLHTHRRIPSRTQ
jgi:hypothetical protein